MRQGILQATPKEGTSRPKESLSVCQEFKVQRVTAQPEAQPEELKGCPRKERSAQRTARWSKTKSPSAKP